MMGTRDPSKLENWLRRSPNACVGHLPDAARFVDVVVPTVKGTATAEALRTTAAANVAGKTTTNPLADETARKRCSHIFHELDESVMERLQREFQTFSQGV
jgi:hypothetical protein